MSSINRSIQVMELLARKGPLGVRAAAQLLSLPVGSVHRILLDLAEENVVMRTADGGWELSHRLLEITGLQLDRVDFPRLAHPFCERIAEVTKETVNVNALNGLTAVCIDKVRGNEGMQLDMRQNITIRLQETLLATSNATTHVLAPTPPNLRRRGGPARRSLPLAVDSPKRRTASAIR